MRPGGREYHIDRVNIADQHYLKAYDIAHAVRLAVGFGILLLFHESEGILKNRTGTEGK